MAIRGIEKLLLQTLETNGAYGIFEAYLHRTLLWRSVESQHMRRLSDTRDRKTPSWSWMAYKGAVSYMRAPYGGVTWNDEVLSPFRDRELGVGTSVADDYRGLELMVVGRRLAVSVEEMGQKVVLDCDETLDGNCLLAVVIGEEKSDAASRKKLVMFVSPWREDSLGVIYQRVGVGTLDARDIADGELHRIRVH